MRHQLSSSTLTRRAFVKTGLSAAGAAGLAVTPQLRGSRYVAGLELAALHVPAHSQTVVQRLGINIQPSFANEYADFDKVRSLLERLGVRKVRARVGPNDPNDAMPYLRSLHTDLGITVHGTAGAFPQTSGERSTMQEQRAEIRRVITQYAGIFDSLGGYNEPNGTRFGSVPSWWLEETLTHQQWLWGLVHGSGADPALRHILVCGPSLHDQVPTLQQDYKRCSVLKPYMERINMHRYPAGSVPSTLIDERTRWAAAGVGEMPVVVTETGYNNGMHSNAYGPVPVDIIAAYADRLLMEHASRGNDMYWFELLNNYPATSPDSENFWGLVAVANRDSATWKRLPAFRTFRRLLALMEDGDAPYRPAALPLTLGGASDVKSYLVGKRDGSYVLALWRDLKLWDRNTQTRLNPQAATARVTFDAPKTVTVYRPSLQRSPYSTARATTHSISLNGNLALLHIAA